MVVSIATDKAARPLEEGTDNGRALSRVRIHGLQCRVASGEWATSDKHEATCFIPWVTSFLPSRCTLMAAHLCTPRAVHSYVSFLRSKNNL